MDIQQLVNPDLLSEAVLLEILNTRCIAIPNAKNLKKADLVEMFKRVALPLPQRHFNESKPLGKKLNDLRINRNISVASIEEQELYKSLISCQNKQSNNSSGKVKSPHENLDSAAKKICLTKSFSETKNAQENGMKRKVNNVEISTKPEGRKRQKIMWP